eukprot:ANDGO_06480.mRNA.1 Peptide deformylase
MEAQTVRLIGDPVLHKRSPEIADVHDPQIVQARLELHATLEKFRKAQGFGRGIAAPQIGYNMRMIALNLGVNNGGVFTMHNPVFRDLSAETFTMWDDCMSFPDFLVRVKRHRSLTVDFLDDDGIPRTLERVDIALSELLQHEGDHLDGITSFDRMHGTNAVVHRKVYEASKQFFDNAVDYSIAPTL